MPRKGVVAYLKEQDAQQNHKQRFTKVRLEGGGTHTVPLHRYFKEGYRDEYTNELLPRVWVEDAMQEELEYVNQKVWVAVPLKDALAEQDGKIISSRWVICNKK